MPRFTVIVTRDTTESTSVVIDAADADEASEKALDISYNDPYIKWEQDYTPNASDDHYVTGVEEDEPTIEELEQSEREIYGHKTDFEQHFGEE